MLHDAKPRAYKRRCRILVVVVLIILSLPLSKILIHIGSFAQSIAAHTVSEKNLPLGYQYALNESLRTVPCCAAANWTPTPAEVMQEQIPRIIHQTYKTSKLPAGDWQTAHDFCLANHPSSDKWEHILWTDATAEKFVANQFPEFLPIYKKYPYPIQRVDAMRYLILYHYGGVYIDLDIGCTRSMLSLLQFPAFFPRTRPLGISNDLIGSRPRHPFMYELSKALHRQGPSKKYGSMYLTVFFTTGPMFVNSVLEKYWRNSVKSADRVLILPENFYSESLTAYFMHYPGSSWHGNDGIGIVLFYTYGWLVMLVLLGGYLFYRVRMRNARGTKQPLYAFLRGPSRGSRRMKSTHEV